MLTGKLARLNRCFRHIHVYTCCCCSENQNKNWRTPWNERKDEWTSGLSVFATGRGPSSEYLRFVQGNIDLRPSSIKRWWNKIKEAGDLMNEQYIPERHQILGNDLAAAHFIVHRGGAVRFYGQNSWLRQDENEEYDLPQFYDPNFCIEAIDASEMRIHFEGLRNLMGLKKIKWLSFEGCPFIDDWCLDRVSGEYQDSLEYLDLRNCPKITANGLGAIYRMTSLQKLVISNPNSDKNVELVCLMLEDIHPNLQIEGVTYISLADDHVKQEPNSVDHQKS